VPGRTFFRLKQTWKSGDVVRLEMPMPLRLVKGRKTQVGRVAVLRGPIVFCLNRTQCESLKGVDLRLLTLQSESLRGPAPGKSVRPEGLACMAQFWSPGAWYPHVAADLRLVLTEYADPAGEATFFHVPNPNAAQFVDDELISKN
jgi:hypothetical protein